MKELTDKQAMFVKEYLVDLNGTQAAIRAGYAKSGARTEGARLLANACVQEAVAKAMKKREDKLEINAEWVLRQAVKVHQRCLQEEPVLDNEGNPIGEYKFEHSGANKALEIIGKHVNIQAFNEKTTVEILDKTEILAKARQRAESSD